MLACGPRPCGVASGPSTPETRESREPGFDQLLERLRQVVTRLEQGNVSLEQSLVMFEEGVKLSRLGSEILDAAERRVEILVKGDDGVDRQKPYSGAGSDGRP